MASYFSNTMDGDLKSIARYTLAQLVVLPMPKHSSRMSNLLLQITARCIGSLVVAYAAPLVIKHVPVTTRITSTEVIAAGGCITGVLLFLLTLLRTAPSGTAAP